MQYIVVLYKRSNCHSELKGVYPQSDGNLPMAFNESISMHQKGSLLSGNTCTVLFRAINELGID